MYEVEGLGTTTFKLPDDLGHKEEHFRGIGLRSNNGIGYCTFSVDDVYIQRKGKCDKQAPKVKTTDPKKNKNKIPRDTDWIEITFNEAMDQNHVSVACPNGWQCSGATPREWTDGQTFTLSRDNAGADLPSKTAMEFTLNPGNDEFRDLKDNPLKQYKFKFTTE